MSDQVEVIKGFPPNIDEIRAVFPLSGGEIFAWDDKIYNPSGGKLMPSLIAHEMVHHRQQAGDPETWWARYLVDATFRFEQELEAHRAEYQHVCSQGLPRNKRRAILKQIARRLASPMYGRIATYEKCRRLISKR